MGDLESSSIRGAQPIFDQQLAFLLCFPRGFDRMRSVLSDDRTEVPLANGTAFTHPIFTSTVADHHANAFSTGTPRHEFSFKGAGVHQA